MLIIAFDELVMPLFQPVTLYAAYRYVILSLYTNLTYIQIYIFA